MSFGFFGAEDGPRNDNIPSAEDNRGTTNHRGKAHGEEFARRGYQRTHAGRDITTPPSSAADAPTPLGTAQVPRREEKRGETEQEDRSFQTD